MTSREEIARALDTAQRPPRYASLEPADDGPEWADPHPWPTLDRAALTGLAGEIVHTIAPDTEADPAALLLTLLTAFGNAVGYASRAMVADDEHPARLFVALVGATSAGRKGTSLAAVRPILRVADEEWFAASEVNGFASGEAIVARLGGYLRGSDSDPIEKRALVLEPEFARLLTINGRDGSTTSPVLRLAWDGRTLRSVKSQKEVVARDAHVSILGHVTADELRAKMTSTEIASGFANRFLFACVRRSRRIPSPRPLQKEIVDGFGRRLNEAMRFSRAPRVLHRSPAAEEIWAEFYNNEPDRDGIVGAATTRSDAQRLRLSVAYALLGESATIEPEHILAAEAVWRYCAASVEHVFGSLRGDSTQDRLLDALRACYPDGLDGSEQHKVFGRNVDAGQLAAARASLERAGLIVTSREKTGGREKLVSTAASLRTNEKIRNNTQDELFNRLSSYVRTDWELPA